MLRANLPTYLVVVHEETPVFCGPWIYYWKMTLETFFLKPTESHFCFRLPDIHADCVSLPREHCPKL